MLTSRRDLVRARLLELARADDRISGAAITGSAAAGREDRWSDIDLFFGVSDVAAVLADFSRHLYKELGALHHFDLTAGPAAYRGFLLEDTLEVDLGFTPAEEFRSYVGAPFRVVFGTPRTPSPPRRTDIGQLAGFVWHHVLHARSAIERGRPLLAEYWISQTRFHTLTLAADRHALDTGYAKGADSLPEPIRASLHAALVRGLDATELSRALQAATIAALAELRQHDAALAERLRVPLLALAEGTAGPQ